VLSIGSVVINVADVRRAAAFWGAALGYEPVRPLADDWVILGPVVGSGQQVSINLSDQVPPQIPHVHLDLYADDPLAELDRLLGLGAHLVEWPLYPDRERDFVVLADPDGNRFCIIDKSPTSQGRPSDG
jgi:catechol 2,3-dioxygenase-like lactoylglutathione lyase family enzyme